MKVVDLSKLIHNGLTVLELFRSRELNKDLACGSTGILIRYTDPRTREQTTYLLARTQRVNEVFPTEGIQ